MFGRIRHNYILKIIMKGKNVLVTGGGGMIAHFLIKILKDLGAKVTSVDLPSAKNNVDIRGDLRSRGFCKQICEEKDFIFNLAGLKGSPQRTIESPATFSVPQVQFGANMVEAAFNSDCEWYLYTSSVGVYHPSDVFYEDDVWKTFPSEHDWHAGWAKRMGELNVEAYMNETGKNNCSIVRPANVYGPFDNFGEWSMVVPSLIKKAQENDILEVWGDGTPIRDLIYAEDVARGMIHMVQNKVIEPVNLGSGNGVTIREIAEIVSNYFHKEIVWDKTKPMGDSKRLMSTERAESYGFKPKVSLKEGLVNTIEWYLNTL
jgi:GDP-L-fucose synthase